MGKRDELYQEAVALYSAALDRLAGAYEADADKRNDLRQDIHLALWRSFDHFQGRCSLRTWIYRVAHHAAASYVIRQLPANRTRLISLEEMESMPDPSDAARDSDDRIALERLLNLIHQLKPLDRELMLLYLEDLDGEEIGEIMGISSGNVRVHIHRIKVILARRFHRGGKP